ncbi:MAG: hypothetical protein ACYCTF_01015 [Acidiferrobacter sp.]
MKADKPANVTLRIVGHRSRLNRHWRLSARQWQVAIGVCVGVVPLLLAFGVYGLLAALVPAVQGPGRSAGAAIVAHAELASITRNTAAGLDVMGSELGALHSDAVRLALLERRLVQSAGLPLGAALHPHARLRTMPVSSAKRPRRISKLRALAQELSLPARKRRTL